MSFKMTEEEWTLCQGLPEMTLVDLAVELDVLVPESIDKRALLESCVPLIVAKAQGEGLPFSKYDLDDLKELPASSLASIAALQGLPRSATAEAIVSAGQKVYRRYSRNNPDSSVAFCLPMLLSAVARAAANP